MSGPRQSLGVLRHSSSRSRGDVGRVGRAGRCLPALCSRRRASASRPSSTWRGDRRSLPPRRRRRAAPRCRRTLALASRDLSSPGRADDTRDLAQRLSYSSLRRHQGPVSLRPLGARSSHADMPQMPSSPRAYVESSRRSHLTPTRLFMAITTLVQQGDFFRARQGPSRRSVGNLRS
jgi:hypothetical protein